MSSHTTDNIANLEQQIGETKDIILDNCDKIFDRDNKISDLNEKSGLLESDSMIFRRRSKKLKYKMITKSYICYFMIFAILLLLIIIIVLKNK